MLKAHQLLSEIKFKDSMKKNQRSIEVLLTYFSIAFSTVFLRDHADDWTHLLQQNRSRIRKEESKSDLFAARDFSAFLRFI